MRDIVVMGSPVGGAAALREIVAALPADLPAAVLIALNTTPGNPILLADVLNSPGGMRATEALDGEPIEKSRIYVAADGKHLTLDGSMIRLNSDAAENKRAPSIDVLFRSAAAAYKKRVVAVLVLHAHDEGALGLRAVRSNGGTVVTHRNAHMPTSPRDPENGEELAHDHLALKEIPPRLIAYVTEVNGNGVAAREH